jgi:hypothetical protein
MKVTIRLAGQTPLLVHNARLANPTDPIARAMKAISSKRTKTDSDFETLARLEFDGGLYYHPDLGPYLPGANIAKSIAEGGVVTKRGKAVERSLLVTDFEVPILYAGPRDPDGLWNDGYFDVASVKVGTSRVMRTRPAFRQWAFEAQAELATDVLNLDALRDVAKDAGRLVGIGDGRRLGFGRYEAEIEKS